MKPVVRLACAVLASYLSVAWVVFDAHWFFEGGNEGRVVRVISLGLAAFYYLLFLAMAESRKTQNK